MCKLLCKLHLQRLKGQNMLKRFVIERNIAGIGNFTDSEFCAAARASNTVISDMKEFVQWQHSYIADNKTFCVYLAESEQAVREHAEKSGMPADVVTEVSNIIDPLAGND